MKTTIAILTITLFAVCAFGQGKEETIKGVKDVVSVYDKFHDQTTIMAKPFSAPAGATKDRLIVTVSAGYVFSGEEQKSSVETLVLYFSPEATGFAATLAQRTQDTGPGGPRRVYFRQGAEVIAMADDNRIKLAPGEKGFPITGKGQSDDSMVVQCSLQDFQRIANAKKLEILVGDIVITPYMPKFGERLRSLATIAQR